MGTQKRKVIETGDTCTNTNYNARVLAANESDSAKDEESCYSKKYSRKYNSSYIEIGFTWCGE